MDGIRQDLRFALRQLAKAPGFAALVVLTLGLGIGANTAIFTLLDQVLLRRLPVHKPEQLVLFDAPGVDSGRREGEQSFSVPMYRAFRDRNHVFAGMLARYATSLSVTEGGRTERVDAELVSGNYFAVLGVPAVLGRILSAQDDVVPGGHPVAMLSHGYWERRFGADPGVLGLSLGVNGQPLTVIGVAPPGFRGIEVGADPALFVPLAMKARMTPTWDDLDNPKSRWVNVMARLKPGLTWQQAKAGMDVLYAQILAEDLELHPEASERFRRLFLAKQLVFQAGLRGRSELREEFGAPLLVLMGMVGLVLLIACANVANLLIARASARQRELAIRLALGAGRRHVVRQLLVESLLLALLSGAAGLALAIWGGELLLSALPFEGAARVFHAEPDVRVGAFTLLASLLTGLLFGLLPALQATRPALVTTLKQEAGSLAGGGSVRFRKALVVAQVALSLLLLVGAGLFARSLHNLRSLDPGFRAERLLAFSVDPALNGYDQDQVREVFRRLEAELRGVPGVRQVSAALEMLLADSEWRSTVRVGGYQAKEGEDMNPSVNAVGPGFFATLGVPLLAGREFDERDARGAPRVAVVNQTFARYYFGEQSPIGRRFGFARDETTDIEIVGLVADGKVVTLRDAPKRFVYTPYAQQESLDRLTFYLRAEADENALAGRIREAVRRVDATLPVFGLTTMSEQIRRSLFVERMTAALSAAFGLLAALLAAVGLYGVMSYAVALRTREIGIRMALGAERARLLWLVMGEVALLAGIGAAIGLPGALALSRLVAAQLYGLSPLDPLTLLLATGGLGAVTLLAGWLPARRATAVDPLVALRYE